MKTWAMYVRPSETAKDLAPGFEIESPDTAATVKNFHEKAEIFHCAISEQRQNKMFGFVQKLFSK